MNGLLKLSTARNVLVFMADAADNASGKAGLTLTITASKDGAAFGSITPTVTDLGVGWYNLAFTTGHSDTLGTLGLSVAGTGAITTVMIFQVVTDLPGATVSSVTGAVASVTAVVSANLTQILGTALTETSGLLAAGFKKFFNVATPTGTINSLPDAVAGAANGLFIAGTNAATTITTAFTTTFTGNLTGSVASVVGNIGGNVVGTVASVLGNVAGSVASVVGAVGSVTGNVGGSVASVVGAVGSVTGNVSGSVASVVGNVGGNVVGSVASVTALGSGAVQSIWDKLTSALTTSGSIGKYIVDIGDEIGLGISNTSIADEINLLVNTVPSLTYTNDSLDDIRATLGDAVGASLSADIAAVKSDTAAIKTKTDNLPSDPADESLIISATDAIVTAVGTRLASSSYTAPDNAGIAAIKTKTDNLPSDPADQSVLAGAIAEIPTNPLLDNDSRLDALGQATEGHDPVDDISGTTLREFMDSILAFIGSESLTDDEFELITLTSADYNKETFDEINLILEMRDSVTDQPVKLRGLFISKGADLSAQGYATPKSNIFIGGKI